MALLNRNCTLDLSIESTASCIQQDPVYPVVPYLLEHL